MATSQLKFLFLCACILGPQPTNGDECLPNLKNIAVYEGQKNIVLNLATDPQNVSWTIRPTSTEPEAYTISDLNGYRDLSLTRFYNINQAGLVIKKATTKGKPIATAGIYIGQCANNPNMTGAKLLVIRSGPKCSRLSINSTLSKVLCKVIYADGTICPIRPIMTWRLNGAYFESPTFQPKRIDLYVYSATSTITVNSGDSGNYRCELTFAAPTDVQHTWFATNAPVFNESCTTSA